ncbi:MULTISPECIES: hypothetical protein [Shouchella]|uniref:Uncharacterized protein n=1 Tax=Shouchella lehensis G1 TaxID=1246626 RepID=A0A060LVM0_9BACI|nr:MULTISPECIES: hypothetical protein [Shouchella]AIC93825.1 hypothetical protein BleG1_1242 [Shouchella lehensis G1]
MFFLLALICQITLFFFITLGALVNKIENKIAFYILWIVTAIPTFYLVFQ